MFAIDRLILIAAILLLIGILSSRFSSRLGLPVLVVFIAIGMLAGSEAIGRIEFEDYGMAHAVGTLALALILFDGGLRTSLPVLRRAWGPSLVLATVGVLITALLTGLAATLLLGIEPLEGLLLGSIVGSTDAAAVFSMLQARALHLEDRLAATLEVESGTNDPMAVFLTVMCLELLLGRASPDIGLLASFGWQMGLGLAAGLAVGKCGAWLIHRVELPAAGLYPVLAGASGLLAYGLAASLGGSGFLSVYVAGIVLGNSDLAFRRGVLLFHDGIAWVGQIAMFILLGLLSFPSRLANVAGDGLLIAAALTLVARPAAVAVCLLPFRYRMREILFIAWVGLKGAVPIVLAIYPLLFGLPGGSLLFDIVFFVVFASAITQGWTAPPLARRLHLQKPAEPEPPVTLEISSVRHVHGDIVEYRVDPGSRAANRRIRELPFPEDVVVSMLVRGDRVVPPRGGTRVEPGDYVFVFMRPDVRPLVDRIFAEHLAVQEDLPAALEFPLTGSTTLGHLQEFYGIEVDAPAHMTLDEFLRSRVGGTPEPGTSVSLGQLALRAREVEDGVVRTVGLTIQAAGEEPGRSEPGQSEPGAGAPEPPIR